MTLFAQCQLRHLPLRWDRPVGEAGAGVGAQPPFPLTDGPEGAGTLGVRR